MSLSKAQKGEELLKASKYKEALVHFHDLVEENPSNSGYYVNLGLC